LAVKVRKLSEIENLGTTLTEYGESIEESALVTESSFQAKTAESQSEAITEYMHVMDQLKNDTFREYAASVQAFGKVCTEYQSDIRGEGFNEKIMSTKPEVEETYCTKFETTQVSTTGDEADAIKKIINEIAAQLPEVSESSIDQSDFEAKIKSQTKEIRQTRSNVQEKQTAFKRQLTEIQARFTSCLAKIEQVNGLTDSASGLSPATLMKMVTEGVMTKATISGIKEFSKKDIEALNHFMKKEYKQAFDSEPDQLSDSVYAIMLTGMMNVMNLQGKKNSEIEQMLNGLLDHPGEFDKVTGYLQRLYNVTGALNYSVSEALFILGESQGITEVTDLENTREKLVCLNSLWEALGYSLSTKEGNIQMDGGAYEVWYTDKIKGLTFGIGGVISFDIQRYETAKQWPEAGTIKSPEKVRKINAEYLRNATEVGESERNSLVTGWRNKQKDYLKEMIKNGTLLAISLWNPAVGGVLGTIVKASDISMSSTKTQQKLVFDGIDTYVKTKYGESSEIYKQFSNGAGARKDFSTRFGSAVELLDSISNYFNAGRELAQAEWKSLASILDIGGLEYSVKYGDDEHAKTETQTVTRSLSNLNYGEALRANEFISNGYQSFFNSLDADVASAIKNNLDPSDGEYGNEYNFILNGGQRNLEKCKVEDIEKALMKAIRQAGQYKNSIPSGLTDKADNWFREYNMNEVIKHLEEKKP
jgi:hypothetical protein